MHSVYSYAGQIHQKLQILRLDQYLCFKSAHDTGGGSRTASSVSVLASRHLDYLEGDDRKLLIFADNRQNTAHQAGYMADRERMFAIRHLVAHCIEEAGEEGIALDDMPQRLLDGLKDLRIIPRRTTRAEQEKWLYP